LTCSRAPGRLPPEIDPTNEGVAVGAKQVLVAVFPNEAAADQAAEKLRDWDKLDDEVKLHSIGVLVLNDEGKVKTHKLGRRSWGAGAGIGVVLAALTPPTLIAGALAGGVLGGLHHKGLGVDSEQRDRLAASLTDGKAAVGVLVREDEAATVSGKLTELGGELEVLTPSDEAVAEVDAAAPAVEAEEAAQGEAPEAAAADAPAAKEAEAPAAADAPAAEAAAGPPGDTPPPPK
jgi:uncharacterized membrane protein